MEYGKNIFRIRNLIEVINSSLGDNKPDDCIKKCHSDMAYPPIGYKLFYQYDNDMDKNVKYAISNDVYELLENQWNIDTKNDERYADFMLNIIMVEVDITMTLNMWDIISNEIKTRGHECIQSPSSFRDEFETRPKEFTNLDFESCVFNVTDDTLKSLNVIANDYIKTGNKASLDILCSVIPSYYKQNRIIMTNYKTLKNLVPVIINKVNQWNEIKEECGREEREFLSFLKELPLSSLYLF